MEFLRSLDPKLVSSILTAALTRAVLAIGGDPVGDPLYSSLISLVLGAVAGYLWPNEATARRQARKRRRR